MDHVVPISLYRTWSANALVLACQPCNQAKADRLFLSIALLLVWSTDPTFTDIRSTPGLPVPVFTDGDRSTRPESIELGPEQVDWLMLARIVQARSKDTHLGSDQGERGRLVERHVRVGRLDHRRRSTRMNTCEQSTDRGVSA